jgi:hypothetical protein
MEWKATKVARLRLDEVAAKVNDAMPGDDDADCASDRWAGAIPIRLSQDDPVPDPKLAAHIAIPDFVRNFRY